MEEVEIREKKKGHGFAIFLLCIAFLLIGAGLMYYYLMVYSNQGNTSVKNENSNAVQLNTNGVLVQELISRLDYDRCGGVNSILYQKSKTTVETLDENYVRILIAKEANGKKVDGINSFTKEEFNKATNTLFGSTYSFNDKAIEGTCPSIMYDSANQVYREDTSISCNTQCGTISNYRYIVKAEKTDENIYIYVAVAGFDEVGKKVYNLNDFNSVIQGIDGNIFDITKDYEKVNNYKYTFNLDKENNNYIFKSIELQK